MDKGSCNICPRHCRANRDNGDVGFCGANDKLKVARASLHMWEEPPISGEDGSGTIFFSNCPLKCVYCQNKNISSGGDGLYISTDRLCEIFFELAHKGANNINLVSPTQYAMQIVEAIKKAKAKGFNLPFVYNTSGYESLETLKMLDGYIDIYLTDFKYIFEDISEKYSSASDYPTVVKTALDQMFLQQPKCVYNDDGMMTGGVIVRHLVLPENTQNSKEVIKYVYERYGEQVVLSIMGQYTPCEKYKYEELNRKISDEEYDELIDFALSLGITNAFVQDGESVSESFIPEFDYTGVIPFGGK